MIILITALAIFIIGITATTIGYVLKKKKIKVLGICILLLFVIGVFIFYIYAIEKDNLQYKSKNGEMEGESILPSPDRIIYKNTNNEYIIITPEDKDFSKIYSELYNRAKKNIDGVVYSEEDIEKMQKEKCFIECDYNTKSKNFIFILDKQEINIIRRFSEGGQVIKKSTYDVDKLMKTIENISSYYEKYNFDDPKVYISKTKLMDFSINLKNKKKREGIYQKIIKNDNSDNNELLYVLEELNFKSDEEIKKVNFNKENVIVTISRYDINNIKANIGNIKYQFGKMNSNYTVNISILSKVSNTNCIYYNISNSSVPNSSNDLSKKVNITTSGTIQEISSNEIKIGFGNYVSTYVAKIDDNTFIMNYETNKEIDVSKLKVGDSIYVEGETSLEIGGIKGIQANKITICSKEMIKKEVSKEILDTYRIDGFGIVYKSVNDNGNGFIIIEGSFDKFIYPIKLNVDNKTETYLGMGYHLQSNYGYILYEMCDITLDKKIIDIDNIEGYVKTIEYIAD